MSVPSTLRSLINVVVPGLEVQSIRREVVRPVAIALAAAGVVGIPVLVSGRAAVVVGALVLWALLAGTVLIVLARLARLEAAVEELTQRVGAEFSLTGLLASAPEVLPPLGDHAMSHANVHALLDLVAVSRPGTIVELGPGASTVLVDRLLETAERDARIYGVEHDASYSSRLRQLASYHSMDRLIVVEAPLEPLTLDGWEGSWYSSAALRQLPSQVDLLVVDGPPRRIGRRARYPAYPVLRDRLRAGSYIFVDDAGRADEAAAVAAWLRSGELAVIERGSNHAILRRRE